MSYVLKRDNYYIKVINNKPTLTSNLGQATQYKKYDTAKNFLHSCITPKQQVGITIVSAPRADIPFYKTEPIKVSNITKSDTMGDLLSIKDDISTRYDEKKTELLKITERCDAIISDIRHFARNENTRLNACQAAKAFYKLQNIERQRETAKKELNRIITIEKFINDTITKADDFDYKDYKPIEVEDMTEFLGL